jgi:aspartate ammonia-lyase
MTLNQSTIADAARRIGIAPDELAVVLQRGRSVSYPGGDYLFHESTPRRWLGLVLEGEVELLYGRHGKKVTVGRAQPGAILSESVILGPSAHGTTAVTRRGATVWQISSDEMDFVRQESPAVFYRIVEQIARRMSERLAAAAERLATGNGPPPLVGVRAERDLLGEREVPNSAYYGIHTVRALENFPFSRIRIGDYEHFVRALACVKKAAALANLELGALEPGMAGAIAKACDEILEGKLHDAFVVDMIQGGAGTSTNMNANEVIANRALELLGHARGDYQFCHPNDHVNCSQSTNDAYPTAVKLGIWFTLRDTLAALRELQTALQAKAAEFARVIKMGRTENQDAVPMTLGQEFGAYAVMIADGIRHLEHAGNELLDTNMGATAIGTGLNSPPGYAELCTKKLAEISGAPVRLALNLVEATQDSGEFALMSGAMKTTAVQLSKICNDLRWLSSGPRCGLYEIRLPAMQAGSSIMPGKVNPVVPEVVSQICFQIIGADVTVAMAAEAGELELNMAEPIIAFNLLFGLTLLRSGAVVLASRCIEGIEANRERCREYVQNSIGLVTALNPALGYEKSAAIAKEALASGKSVYDLVIAKNWLTREKLGELLEPENMIDPRSIPAASAV